MLLSPHPLQHHPCLKPAPPAEEHESQHKRAQKDLVQADKDLVWAQKDLVQGQEDLVWAQEDLVHAREDLVRAQEDLVQAEEDLVRAQEDLVRAQKDLVRAQKDLVRSEKDRSKGGWVLAPERMASRVWLCWGVYVGHGRTELLCSPFKGGVQEISSGHPPRWRRGGGGGDKGPFPNATAEAAAGRVEALNWLLPICSAWEE